jgi:hypothetical protein
MAETSSGDWRIWMSFDERQYHALFDRRYPPVATSELVTSGHITQGLAFQCRHYARHFFFRAATQVQNKWTIQVSYRPTTTLSQCLFNAECVEGDPG